MALKRNESDRQEGEGARPADGREGEGRREEGRGERKGGVSFCICGGAKFSGINVKGNEDQGGQGRLSKIYIGFGFLLTRDVWRGNSWRFNFLF